MWKSVQCSDDVFGDPGSIEGRVCVCRQDNLTSVLRSTLWEQQRHEVQEKQMYLSDVDKQTSSQTLRAEHSKQTQRSKAEHSKKAKAKSEAKQSARLQSLEQYHQSVKQVNALNKTLIQELSQELQGEQAKYHQLLWTKIKQHHAHQRAVARQNEQEPHPFKPLAKFFGYEEKSHDIRSKHSYNRIDEQIEANLLAKKNAAVRLAEPRTADEAASIMEEVERFGVNDTDTDAAQKNLEDARAQRDLLETEIVMEEAREKARLWKEAHEHRLQITDELEKELGKEILQEESQKQEEGKDELEKDIKREVLLLDHPEESDEANAK